MVERVGAPSFQSPLHAHSQFPTPLVNTRVCAVVVVPLQHLDPSSSNKCMHDYIPLVSIQSLSLLLLSPFPGRKGERGETPQKHQMKGLVKATYWPPIALAFRKRRTEAWTGWK